MSIRHLYFLLLLCPALLAGAAETSVAFSAIPGYVIKHNPDLAAARLRIAEAQGRLLGAGRRSNPELEFSATRSHEFREGTIGLGFNQKFPVTARLSIEKVLSGQLVTSAELEVKDQQRKVIAEAQSLAVEILILDQLKTLRSQQAELAQKLSKFAADRANTGEISPLDAAQAQVDTQQLILEDRKLATERIRLLGELKPKLGLYSSTSLKITGALPAIATPSKNAWKQRPDYLLSANNEAASLTEIDLAKSKKWDDVTAGFLLEGERMEDAPNGLENTGFFGFRFSIPLPFWNKNEGEVAEKTAAAARASLETKALASGIQNEAAAAKEEMAAYASLAKQTKDQMLPLVAEQTDRLSKAYESGQTDLITLLRARDQRLQLEVSIQESIKNYQLARIRYEAATNTQPIR